VLVFFFQAEDGIRDKLVTGVQTCALPIYAPGHARAGASVDGSRRDAHGGGGWRLWLLRDQRSVAGRTAKSAGSRHALGAGDQGRSEERRVGKEWSSRGSP